jgi:uncharacterized protein
MFALRTAAAVFAAGLLASFATAADLKFEVFKDKGGEFRWRLKDGDTEIGNSGQGYSKKADAMNGAERIQKDGADDKKVTFEVYEDNAKKFRWRAKVKNGNQIAAASKGYDKKEDAEAAVKLIQEKAGKAEIAEVKEDK